MKTGNRHLTVLAFVFSTAVLFAAGGEDSRVADATMQGDKDTVRSLLKQGADVNAPHGDGMSALHWAARSGDAELVQMLVVAGANHRATTRLGGWTPLLLAAQYGHAAVIGTLLKAGADPKAATTNGTTPLMLAAASGTAQAVKLLLDQKVDVDAKESARGQTALMFAAAYNRTDAMKLLLEAGADVNAVSRVSDLRAPTNTNPEEEAFLQAQQQGRRAAFAAAAPAQSGYGSTTPAPAPATAAADRGRGGREAAPSSEPRPPDVAGSTRQFRFAELVTAQGGLTPVFFAVRQGHIDAVKVLLDAGANIKTARAADATSPLLMAIVNGHFDLAAILLEHGADPRLAGDNGVTPLYAVLNVQWAPKALYPQPQAHLQQKLTHLDMMRMLLDRGVDVNARLRKKVWYSGYNFDLSGVDEIGATPFWRAAYAADVDAMKLLMSHGADPNIPTMKPAGRPRTGDGGRETVEDVSGQLPVPIGGPAVTPLQAAAGVGYGEGFAANSHHHAPNGWMPAIRYLVEEIGADVNARDHEGNTALHHAAARGDNEMILYLVSKGADVKAVNRAGETTADMANGPVQRIQPFPETIALLEKLGAKNNHRCKSC